MKKPALCGLRDKLEPSQNVDAPQLSTILFWGTARNLCSVVFEISVVSVYVLFKFINMSAISIFVSSTCFDLKSLREHLRSEISSWGHTPVLSEYSSFPVSPELSTVENCKRVVEEHADVFVLIVGGKRGSLDSETARSVVNSEYREARAKGIDCFVFADKSVWDLLPLYKNNPTVDFNPTVDSPAVFQFLEEVRDDTRWIFPFTRTDEIVTTLRVQLSIRFKDLLQRHRNGRLQVHPSFSGEAAHIARIATDRGSMWEFRLASELLRDRVDRLTMRFAELNDGFVVRRTKFLHPKDTVGFVQDLINDFSLIVKTLTRILENQLIEAFGPPGKPGDAVKIKSACDNLYSIFLSLYEWEMDVRFVRTHDKFSEIFQLMSGWADCLLDELGKVPQEIERILSIPNLKGHHMIDLKIASPRNADKLSELMKRMKNDPEIIKLAFLDN